MAFTQAIRSNEALPVVEASILFLVIGLPLVGTTVTALKGRPVLAFVSADLTVVVAGLALAALDAAGSGMPEPGSWRRTSLRVS